MERYSHTKHYELVGKWLAGYGLTIPPQSFFPPVGFVSDGICVGFLYLTQSSKAWIDQIVADRTADSAARSRALDALLDALKQCASDEGVQMLQVMTTEPLVTRFVKHGFKEHGNNYTFLIR